ncbi:hypothetical protein [Homoserinimonas hongtaonis]|uniref:DUF1129 domain-containing protein n=1 Tax=Homoserinimonas hongtaonis TaxID=2079791 RepID=A0A2U1SZZ7_9MICO|nr:hypothetical protein [Salinibacterium hongtaonis]PWB97215.1 hypothetical protein DF220_04735 [Salinibacterium hongtaonis]
MNTMSRRGAPMNKGRRTGFGSIETYTRLAPNVDKGWVEQFVLEQRLIGVSGKRIGDSLALVESHVAESGESAQAAFGDPQAYAKEDAPAQSERSSGRIDRGWGFGIVLGLAGMLLTTFSAQAGFAGESALQVTIGHLVVLAIVAAAVALLVLKTHALMRVLAQLPIRSWIGWMVLLAAMVGALFFLPHPIGEIGVLAASVIGVVLLTVGLLVQLRAYLGGRVEEDEIVGPGEQPGRSRAGLVAVLIFPAATIAMIGFSWLLQQIPDLI